MKTVFTLIGLAGIGYVTYPLWKSRYKKQG